MWENRLTLKLSYDTDITVVRKLSSLEVQDFECAHTYDSIQRVDSTTGQHIFELFDSARSGIQGAISIVSIIAVIAILEPVDCGSAFNCTYSCSYSHVPVTKQSL